MVIRCFNNADIRDLLAPYIIDEKNNGSKKNSTGTKSLLSNNPINPNQPTKSNQPSSAVVQKERGASTSSNHRNPKKNPTHAAQKTQ